MSLEDELLKLIRERGGATTTELVKLTGQPRHKVLRALNKLYFKGLIEPIKRSRQYVWQPASGEMRIFPLHTPLTLIHYIEGVIEPIFRRVENRIDSFLFVHVRNETYWLCDCGAEFYVLTDDRIDGCNCKLRHAFGERRLAMIYLTGDLRFRYWHSYRYAEEDVEFIVLMPDPQISESLMEKYKKYTEELTDKATHGQ